MLIRPFCSSLVALALAALPAGAASLLITYELDEGTATFTPFDIPNPQGGADLTITPSLTINSGSFQAVFDTGSGIVGVGGSPASIRGLTFTGSITITVATVIDTGLFPLPVQANLSGPLEGIQNTNSAGTTAILGGDTVYTDTSPGLFDVTAGPLDCTDSAFGVVCTLLEAGLGVTFPIEIPAADNAPIPFAGIFRDLNSPGASTSGSQFDFSVPINDTTSFDAEIAFTWTESARVLVPEPSLAMLSPCLLLLLAARRRSQA